MTEHHDGPSCSSPPSPLPARMLNEFVYCPRLFYLEWVLSEFDENLDVAEGKSVHKRVDKESGALPTPEDMPPEESLVAKSVMLSSERLDIIAKMDLVEGSEGKVIPIDYKKGCPPYGDVEIWDPDRAQIVAQVAILRDSGYVCDSGIVYYSSAKRRIEVPVSDTDLDRLADVVRAARETAASSDIPPPLEDSPKCPRCSLVGICLPDETRSLTAGADGDGEGLSETEIRRMYPARDDSLPVYVQEQGASINKKGEVLEIRRGGQVIDKARLMETSQVSLFGSVQVTPSVVHELCKRGIPLCHFSYGGWFYGMTGGMPHKNVHLRISQYDAARDVGRSLTIARRFVEGKIRNCRTLLRRNHKGNPQKAIDELMEWVDAVNRAKGVDELMGVEGSAARVYFHAFSGMISGSTDDVEFSFDFNSRNRRPPKDPVNCMLSFIYAVLCKDVGITLMSVGFDPYLGFLHRPRYGRPALALDVMEEFRPLIADSTVVTVINNGMLGRNHFVRRGNSWSLTADGRKTVLGAYERRMNALVTHPIFGYSVSYRRVLEVQARLLGRCLTGELNEYVPFCTR